VGSGGGGVVGSGGGGSVVGGSVVGGSVVGGAGGGVGVLLLLVGSGAGGLLVVGRGADGALLVSSAPPAGAGRVGVALRLGLTLGADRPDRDAGGAFRAVAGLTDPAGCTSAAGFSAGVAPAIAAARAPVAITDPAATPLLTNDSRRSARSRWWVGGEAIESLSARASALPSPVIGRLLATNPAPRSPAAPVRIPPHRGLRVLRNRPSRRSAEVCIKEP
jgi:hypothetical protein